MAKHKIFHKRKVNIIKIFKNFYCHLAHYKRFSHIFEGFNSPIYSNSGMKEKSFLTKLLDFLYIFFVLKYLPHNYHLYCFNVKKRKDFSNYIGDRDEPLIIEKLKILSAGNGVLLDDKMFFNIICKHFSIPTTKQLSFYKINGVLRNSEELLNLMYENDLQKIVIKPRFGRFGTGIYFLSIDELPKIKLDLSFKENENIIEVPIKQHSEMNDINPFSVNSIRIITILSVHEKVEILGAMLRTSSSNIINVDNFSLGGIVIGINIETGKLKKRGIIKNFISFNDSELNLSLSFNSLQNLLSKKKKNKLIKPGKILEKHPITGIKFNDFQIPYWNELLNTAIKAQNVFKHIKSIGWDIAISENGPVLIEGNTLWQTTGIQAANGGLLTDKNRCLLKEYGISFNS